MRMKQLAGLVVAVVLLASSCSGERAGPESSAGAITSFPSPCSGLGPVYAGGQTTFVKGNRVFATRRRANLVRCIARDFSGDGIRWGGTGDRFLVDRAGNDGVYLADETTLVGQPSGDAVLQGLSRPEGTQVVYIGDGGRRLVKVPAEGGPADDISFLARHDEAVYHPAGTHIAVVGEDDSGNYGIFLATNEGTDVEQLVAVDAARTVYEPAFSHDGDTMYYVADHGALWDLHDFSLSTTPNAATETELGTVAEFDRKIDRVRVSEFDDGRVAFRVGDCESGFSTYVHQESETHQVVTGHGDTGPVGWLPNGDLIVAASADPCGADPSFDLYRVTPNNQRLLVSDVRAPAIRAPLPPPPKPPERAPEVIA